MYIQAEKQFDQSCEVVLDALLDVLGKVPWDDELQLITPKGNHARRVGDQCFWQRDCGSYIEEFTMTVLERIPNQRHAVDFRLTGIVLPDVPNTNYLPIEAAQLAQIRKAISEDRGQKYICIIELTELSDTSCSASVAYQYKCAFLGSILLKLIGRFIESPSQNVLALVDSHLNPPQLA
jgi:hypothetical protein